MGKAKENIVNDILNELFEKVNKQININIYLKSKD